MYTFDNALAQACAKVISEEPLFESLAGCRLCVLFCNKEKKSRGRIVYADTKKLSDMVSFMTGYDFVITFYADVEYLTDKALGVLIRHELLHIGYESRGGVVTKKIYPHDVEDFRAIIGHYGIDWPLLQDEMKKEEADG